MAWTAEHKKKKCAEYNRTYYLRHPERIKAKRKEYSRAHKKENNERVKEWQRRNPEKVREWARRYQERMREYREKHGLVAPKRVRKFTNRKEEILWYKYSLPLAEYEGMLLRQSGACLICLSNEKKLVVDHCHRTKKVRGLLCAQCNSALGFLKENTESLVRAVAYLQKYG